MIDLEKYTGYTDDLDTWYTTYNGLHEYGYESDN